jgi:hypothetical protein
MRRWLRGYRLLGVADEYYYKRQMPETLLPHLWSEDIDNTLLFQLYHSCILAFADMNYDLTALQNSYF